MDVNFSCSEGLAWHTAGLGALTGTTSGPDRAGKGDATAGSAMFTPLDLSDPDWSIEFGLGKSGTK